MKLQPESFLARVSLAFKFHALGQYGNAVGVIERGLAMSGRHPMFMALLVVTLADCEKLADAKLVYAEFQARSAREYVSPFSMALSSAAIRDRGGATRFAQMAFETHDPQLTTFGKYWPGSKRLREECRFDEILAKMGLK